MYQLIFLHTDDYKISVTKLKRLVYTSREMFLWILMTVFRFENISKRNKSANSLHEHKLNCGLF